MRQHSLAGWLDLVLEGQQVLDQGSESHKDFVARRVKLVSCIVW